MEQLEKDIAAANSTLQNTPFDLLRDPDGLNLRKYQINAIEAAEQAVIDGKQTVLLSMATGTGKTRTILGMIYLVDHDAPHNIRTKLRVEGIKYEKGEQLAIYDPVTGEVLNSAELEDDMKFEIDTFNRQVITENFNRTVLNEI